MHHAFKRVATGAALALLLAACGGSGSDNDTVDPNPAPGTTQSQFGPVFEQAFNRSATADPAGDLTPDSIGGVSFTADPVAID